MAVDGAEDHEADVQKLRQVGPYRFTPTKERIMNAQRPARVDALYTIFPQDVAELVTRIETLESYLHVLPSNMKDMRHRMDTHHERIVGLEERLAIIVSDISDQRGTLDQLRLLGERTPAAHAARSASTLDELLVAEDLLGLIHAEINKGEGINLYAIPGLVEAWEILVKNATP